MIIKLFDKNNKRIKQGMKVQKGNRIEIVAKHEGGHYPFIYFPFKYANPSDEAKVAKEWTIINN